MRNTKQKNVIYSIVNDSSKHLTAYQIYELSRKEISNISLGTVYRNLSNLVFENKIRKLLVSGVDRYDKNVWHSHFVCTRCNDVIDIFDDNLMGKKNINGNLVTDCEINYKGICKKCIEREENDNGIKRKQDRTKLNDSFCRRVSSKK